MWPGGANAGSPFKGTWIPNGCFIDETWIKTNMAPLRGWARKGKRLRGFAPGANGPSLARCDVTAWLPLASSTVRSTAYVFAGHSGSDKGAVIRQGIKDAGARLWFLPP